MTDNEIKKALKYKMIGYCDRCEVRSTYNCDNCIFGYVKQALDYINRLEAENSNLTSNLTSLQNDLTSAKAEVEELRSNLDVVNHTISYFKSEAVKEFVERLKGSLALNVRVSNDDYLDIATDVDNLVKEMVGE